MTDRRALKSYEHGPKRATQTKVVGKSRTKQSFTEQCDINKMMKKYVRTGAAPVLNKREPHYGDFSQAKDLHSAMNQVMAAQDEFETLPSEVRNLCDNDPELLLRALASPEETAALFDAGLPMADDYKPWREPEKAETPAGDEKAPEETPPITGGE